MRTALMFARPPERMAAISSLSGASQTASKSGKSLAQVRVRTLAVRRRGIVRQERVNEGIERIVPAPLQLARTVGLAQDRRDAGELPAEGMEPPVLT